MKMEYKVPVDDPDESRHKEKEELDLMTGVDPHYCRELNCSKDIKVMLVKGREEYFYCTAHGLVHFISDNSVKEMKKVPE